MLKLSAPTGTPPDFSSIAGFYSQLAAVLAGFAFAGLVALIASQLAADNKAGASFQSFVPLISSFIGLVGTSLNYAIIAGDGSGDKRATLLETIGGLAFSVAGLMLFYSLVVLLHGARVDSATEPASDSSPGAISNTVAVRSVSFARLTLVLGVAPAVVVLLEGGIADQEIAEYGSNSDFHWLDYVSIAMLVIVLAYAAFRIHDTRHVSQPETPPSPMFISGSAVAISIACVLITNVVGGWASPNTIGPDIFRLVQMLILLGFDLAVIHSAVKYR
jgi:hypothetical protein